MRTMKIRYIRKRRIRYRLVAEAAPPPVAKPQAKARTNGTGKKSGLSAALYRMFSS